MTSSASMVAEASAEVGSIALTLPEDKEISTYNQQRLLILAEKGIVLTVWKITPIKRNFIFGIVGLLFTYALMFYSLIPVERN
ncbi:hypothetical protein TNCT_279091 [Trichonephila clavata]|uniref:Uncharacterized protein n=1 Tax=Trichonephila clavata TaxID=2740835 RepID=A0A8X6G4Q2_TRICU|nr:hypothetical protein TNCT_279091 [Trichonephila clavata]